MKTSSISPDIFLTNGELESERRISILAESHHSSICANIRGVVLMLRHSFPDTCRITSESRRSLLPPPHTAHRRNSKHNNIQEEPARLMDFCGEKCDSILKCAST
ncbi:hypothetical protein AVEN_229604-1 [Araneus ventricosus]|uniref:Uncharacterized protein n=1 Tax=Araneus ventricosus TaxID=182803 RepID=A0A4Y2DA09_ARAVE|nr:hypothetical protein AVEN_229604-1 [Araneus ventricosus]